MAEEQIEITLKLNHIEALFAEPAADPFDPDSRYISGIEEIAGQLRLKRRDLHKKLRLLIELPQGALNLETEATVSAALHRYCTAVIAENQQVIEELRLSSRRQAVSALILVVVLIIFTILLVTSVPGLQAVSGAIAGFVGIAVWVIFWDPIYNYVYAWRPNQLEIKVHENIREADLKIVSFKVPNESLTS